MALTSDRRVEQATEKAGIERGKAVEAAILAIEKQFGRGSIMRLGSAERQQVDFIPSGSIALDLALGVGGIPRGRITEVFGPESSGKTTLCQHIIAEAQRRGGRRRPTRADVAEQGSGLALSGRLKPPGARTRWPITPGTLSRR